MANKLIIIKGGFMKEEKKQEKKEKEITVLDSGINIEDVAGPLSGCCRGAFFPYR